MKKNLLFLGIIALSALQCVSISNRIDRHRAGENPYLKEPFYAKYLNTGTKLDAQIKDRLQALSIEPHSPALHNELGMLLWGKGFPKDAEREFRRAIADDGKFYPAWFNLGLAQQARGNTVGAKSAFHKVIELKPGDASALFELGLMAERAGRNSTAIDFYAKAFRINPDLLDVRVNARIVYSKLVPRALIAMYPNAYQNESVQFHPAPTGYVAPVRPPAPSSSVNIVVPESPATEQGVQTPPPAAAPPAPAPPMNPNPQQQPAPAPPPATPPPTTNK